MRINLRKVINKTVKFIVNSVFEKNNPEKKTRVEISAEGGKERPPTRSL
jgi:hypothetical protein